jgi:hypothetical protein
MVHKQQEEAWWLWSHRRGWDCADSVGKVHPKVTKWAILFRPHITNVSATNTGWSLCSNQGRTCRTIPGGGVRWSCEIGVEDESFLCAVLSYYVLLTWFGGGVKASIIHIATVVHIAGAMYISDELLDLPSFALYFCQSAECYWNRLEQSSPYTGKALSKEADRGFLSPRYLLFINLPTIFPSISQPTSPFFLPKSTVSQLPAFLKALAVSRLMWHPPKKKGQTIS